MEAQRDSAAQLYRTLQVAASALGWAVAGDAREAARLLSEVVDLDGNYIPPDGGGVQGEDEGPRVGLHPTSARRTPAPPEPTTLRPLGGYEPPVARCDYCALGTWEPAMIGRPCGANRGSWSCAGTFRPVPPRRERPTGPGRRAS